MSVADGQRRLDHHMLALQYAHQRQVDEGGHPHAFNTPWFRFSDVHTELKLIFSTQLVAPSASEQGEFYERELFARPPRPDMRDDEQEVVSSIEFSLVPVPPETTGGHKLQDEEDGE